MATQDKWEKQHLKSIAKYERLIKQIYDKYVQEAARIGADITSFDASNPLAFDDYPLTRKRIEALQKHMASDIEAVVFNGIDEQWALADGKTSALIATAFAGLSAEELEERKAKYLTNRDDAREAFKTRKENGMNISDRVWRYTDQFKEEMEMGIDLGLRDGKSADALSRDLRKYLNNPDMLFRRVRDEHGVLHLSKRAKAYHPGQGVYRSSYKNARRLAATETNIAYRTADHDRVQDLDFVVGIRVNLSNNHTLNGEPFTDICDELSAPFGSKATKGKGCYPKDFKFTGWHPLCRCFITTILKTEEEMDADDERIMSGDEPTEPSESKNYVEDVPENFKAWSKNNAERVERAKSVPYFIRDNRGYYNDAVNPKLKELTPIELAEQRHAQRTPEQAQAIRDRWRERQEHIKGFSAEQLAHFKKMEADLGIKRGMPMSVDDADKQNANPNFVNRFVFDPNGAYSDGTRRYSLNPKYNKSLHRPYSINCQTCAPAYMLRLQGFDVTAKPNTPGSALEHLSRGYNVWSVWNNADGTPARHSSFVDWMSAKNYKRMTPGRYIEFFEAQCKDEGVYELSIGWKRGGGHATIIQRFADGSLRYIEPQADNSIGSGYEWKDLMHLANSGEGSPHGCRGIMRIDDKLFNLLYTGIFNR